MTPDDLTPSQYAIICNGVGPKGLSFRCVQLRFKRPADQHDLDYWIGGGYREKFDADYRFFFACVSCSRRNPFMLSMAFLYFGMVLCFGFPWFHFGKQRELR